MKCRWLLAVAYVYAVSCIEVATAQDKSVSTNDPSLTACNEKSDRRFSVCRGAWSGKSTALFNTWMAPDTNPERRLDLPSPDGNKVISVRGFRVRLWMNGKSYWTPFGNMHDAEAAWAPDSTRLFVTWSESGQLGPWHVQVYDLAHEGLKESPNITRNARKDILARERKAQLPRWVTSEYRGVWASDDYCEPDMVGSQWINGPSEVLVAAMAGPDGGCKYYGDFLVYRIEVPSGKILQSYKASEAVQLFGDGNLPRLEDDGDNL
jgi:hypothetical protein